VPFLIEDVVLPGALAALPQPHLPADGLTLRPWCAGDRSAVVAAYADPAIRQWHSRSLDDAEAAAWIEAWPQRWHAETGAGWAVADGGAVVGQIALRTIELAAGLAEVSYWVLPGNRGRRIAPRALAALTAWSFGTLGLHRIVLRHSVANTASCAVATRGGFPLEGTLRADCLHLDGWHDMHLHARLASD
jgi:RimJ/RimL family protein N-acetyltransferase